MVRVNSQQINQVPTFSILDVLFGLGRRKLFILTSLILGMLLGVAIIKIFEPTYVAEARVLIEALDTPYDAANVSQQKTSDVKIDERVITSQVSVLQSDDLLRRIIDSLQLGQSDEFDPMRRGLGMISQIKIGLGFSNDPRNMSVEDRALSHLAGNLTVFELEKSNVIGIKYEAGDGKTAAGVANALAQTYVLSTREASSGTNNRAREWLSGQIDGLRTKVASSDAAVEKFRSEKGLFKSRESTLGNQEIAELNSQITLADAASTEAEAKAQEIRELLASEGSVDASAEILSSSTIQRLRELQVTSERRISELSTTYLPNHPKMVAAQRDLANVEKQIRREALKIVESLQGQAKIAAKRAQSLRSSMDNLKVRESGSAQDEVRLKELEREAKANRDQLEVMLARFADSNTRQNLDLQPGFARIIQMAAPPANPSFPKLGPTILLTSTSGLLIGLGLAFLMEVMAQASRASAAVFDQFAEDDEDMPPARNKFAVRTTANAERPMPDLGFPEDVVEPAMVSPVVVPVQKPGPAPTQNATPPIVMSLATTPSARTAGEARDLLNLMSSGNSLSASFEQLTSQLQALNRKGALKAFAVAGVGAGLEVAASSLALGRDLANAGFKTILIDLDAQRSLIPDLMELPFAPGIAELVSGQADFGKTIQRDKHSSLQVIRHGGNAAGIAAQLAHRMESVTRTLSTIYDVVLLHTGEASPSTLSVVKGCNAILLYAPKQRQRDAAEAASTLRSNGIENVYIVDVEGPLQQAA
jgi:polysaccharide biosynthesis transport protein